MNAFDTISLSTKKFGVVDVKPRIEIVLSSVDYYNKNKCYGELLCLVENEDGIIPPHEFFHEIEDFEVVSLYRRVIGLINQRVDLNVGVISLNTPLSIINDAGTIALLKSSKQRFALELMEEEVCKLSFCECGILNDSKGSLEIWLDDFGQKSSNFDFISGGRVSLDKVKISKEVFWYAFDKNKSFLIELIRLFKGCDLDVVVEGVETNEHFCFLSNLGCLMQGFYFNSLWSE